MSAADAGEPAADRRQGPSPTALRICIASPDIVGPIRNGGVGTACTALAQALAQAGHEVTLFYTSSHYENGDAQTWIDYYAPFGVRFVALADKPSPEPHVNPTIYESDPAERSYRVYDWLKTQSFDVIHFPDYIGLGYFTALAKRQGIHFQDTAICVTAHAPTLWARLGNSAMINDLAYLIRDRMERGVVEHCDLLISPSRYMIEWMEENRWALPERRIVLPNLMPTSKIGETENRLGQPSAVEPQQIREIVFFGRIEPRKGLLVFCDAIDRLIHRVDKELLVTFMGKTREGEYGSFDLLGARLRKWPFRWQLIDSFDTFQARAYLSEAGRLAVIPSLADNSPYTVLECLSWAIPFIASDVGGVRELVHEQDRERVLFAPQPRAIADKLVEAVADGFVPARMSFTPEANKARHLELHAEMLPSVLAGQRHDAAAPVAGNGSAVAATAPKGPLVSVCLLHFERPDDLVKAVDSIRRQTYRNFEIVVVDNGSKSVKAIETLAQLANEFDLRGWRVCRLEHNMYEPHARNHGAQASRGKYVLFMDDDNVAKDRELETFTAVAERTGAQVLTCFMDYFDTADPPAEESQALKRFIPIGDAGPVGLIYNGYGDVNCFVEREAFLRIGGFVEDGRFNHAEDWRFLAKAFAHGLKTSVVPEALVWYRTLNQPYNMSWRKRDRSGALMRAAATYFEQAPPDVQPFVLLAQGLFWKAHESAGRIRDMQAETRRGKAEARSLRDDLDRIEREYRHLIAEYRKLQTVVSTLLGQVETPTPEIHRMIASTAIGRRRHFGYDAADLMNGHHSRDI